MAKSVDQRLKELESANASTELVSTWSKVASAYKKDLDAPIFRKIGDIASMAKRYDADAASFQKFEQQQADVLDMFGDADKVNEDFGKRVRDLFDELEKLLPDEVKSLTLKKATSVDEGLNNFEELVKGYQDVNKERKPVFERLLKVGDERVKALNDCIAKIRKAADAAKAGLVKSNNELNTLEAQIRAAVIGYQKAAIDMDRKEIADAVRGFLAVFGR